MLPAIFPSLVHQQSNPDSILTFPIVPAWLFQWVCRRMDDMIGHAEFLEVDESVVADNPKLADVDLSRILLPAATLRWVFVSA